jgi:predicted DNA-binding transcriptional regulator AlpA
VTNHLLGTKEAAALLGVSKQGLFHLVDTHPDFPAPTATLASGRIWERKAVEAWATAHGRTRHEADA